MAKHATAITRFPEPISIHDVRDAGIRLSDEDLTRLEAFNGVLRLGDEMLVFSHVPVAIEEGDVVVRHPDDLAWKLTSGTSTQIRNSVTHIPWEQRTHMKTLYDHGSDEPWEERR